jgi:phage tail sheath protein FI
MAIEANYPGVYVEEIPMGVRTITGVATSIAAFAGWTRRGPADRAKLVTSWNDFDSRFGGLDARSLLGYSVFQFFNNGGTKAYIVRLTSKRTVLQPNEPNFENALLPADGAKGLYHLDRVDLFNLLCVPGETNSKTITELQDFCRKRRAFLIADCAQAARFEDVKAGPGDITGENAMNAAFYFPWILAPDKLQKNLEREFPPCGFVAGIYARTDAARGVWKAPAGNDASLIGVVGLSQNKNVSDTQNRVLNTKAVNCIRTFPVHGTVVWGARTLHGSDERASEWKYVPVRRTTLFIEESLRRGLKWAVFEPNDEPLWAQIRLNVGNFMHILFREGAFQGTSPKYAYFVKCDRETTTQNDVDQGIVNIIVGFAPLKPAEFVIIKLQQMAGKTRTSSRRQESKENVMAKSRVNAQRFDPYKNFKFRVKLDGKYVAGASKIKPKASREDLSLTGTARTTFGRIIGQFERPKGRGSKSAGGTSALFVGPKGTGKTLAAEVVATQLGTDLYRIDLSKVVSKYIGETEKNLARVFAAAEDAGAVLFFDEADALFGKRSNVRDSHDRYANIEISYLLQRLESYSGLVILATNRKKNIDEAFVRRLRFIVNFPFPGA